MSDTDFVIRVGGESGDGMVTIGDIITAAAAEQGAWAYTFRTYPAEIRGGPVLFQLRTDTTQVLSNWRSGRRTRHAEQRGVDAAP